MIKKKTGKIILPGGVAPWPHEMHVAQILSDAGNVVEFIPKGNVRTADILLNGAEFEIKSPKTSRANSLEHILKKALRQSVNIIIDSSRMQMIEDIKVQSFLIRQAQSRKRIKRMLFIMKSGDIIDIK